LPVLDTEILFALNPKDRLHSQALRLLAELRQEGLRVYAPDTSILEFQVVLRSLDKSPLVIRKAILGLRRALEINGVTEASTLDSELIARQCEIEERHGLTFFDSFIAASTLRLDSVIISDDRSFDRLLGITRKELSLKARGTNSSM